MKTKSINLLSFMLILAMLYTPKTVAQDNIPLEDFFKNPEKSSYQISPDGKYFSYRAPYKKRMNIFVQKVGSKKAVRLTSVTDRDIAGYYWANPKKILYIKDSGGDENFSLYVVDKTGKNEKCLTCIDGVRTQIIDDLEDLPDEMIIGLNKRDKRIFDAYRLNIKTGKMDMIAENPGNIQGWMTDHAGKLRVAFAIVDGINTQILYREKETDKFKAVYTGSFKESLNPLFFTFDNKKMYVSSNLNRDKSAIYIYDIANNKFEDLIFENDKYDVAGLNYSKKRKVLTSVSWTSWKRQKHYLDKETEKLYKRLEKKLGEYEIVVTGLNKEEDKMIIRTYSDRSLGAYYFYDKKTDKLDKIVDVSPWIDENKMAVQKPIKYIARDGLEIEGYLTLPKGVDPKNLPVVVNPHGGPWARDRWGFNAEAQFLASRGYAVFQMNFRGSTGYGKEFWKKSFKQWGLSMQNDITDGVYWLIREGIADPDKVAIYGGSYGGYATLQGIVVNPTLYSAAVDYVGVSNMFSFLKTIPPYWKPMLQMMYEMVGDPAKDSIQFHATSPALNAHKIITPLFVAQGKNDPRVNINEADQIVDALKKRGVKVEYMVKDNEGHGFRNEENRFDFYRAMIKFLNKHLKNE